MTDNKSFRINNKQCGNATIWPISAHLYSVKWDDWENSYTVFATQVGENLGDGTWTKIEETLLRSFKFVHINDGKESKIVYTFTVDEKGNTYISWDSDSNPGRTNQWSVEEARDLISRGKWVVLPSEPEKKSYISSISYQVNVDATEANKQLAETIALAERLEEALKSLKKVMGEDFVKIDVKGIL